MDIKKLAPWNWFKKEEEESGHALPIKYGGKQAPITERGIHGSIQQLHREMDRLFDGFFSDYGMPSFGFERPFSAMTPAGMLKPQVDIGASDKEYSITVEVPGVSEKDVTVEIVNNTMTIRGEKKQEKEEKEKNYYRVERSYGSFQRVLSLPQDADQEDVKATFKNGVLTVAIPRKTLPKSEAKRIDIKSGE